MKEDHRLTELLKEKHSNFWIELFTMILAGNVINPADVERHKWLLYNMANANDIESRELKNRISKFKRGVPAYLAAIEKGLEEIEQFVDAGLQVEKQMLKRLENLPEGCFSSDRDSLIVFAKKLKKPLFNYSEAEKLVGVTRQTLKNHCEQKKWGLQELRSGRTNYLTREGLIAYYRNKLNAEDTSMPF
jgi:PAS domain-containing protein